ncbi:MAG: formate dehydrogenase [Desulfobulbaceae bacterium]|nr:formate dehydrogenase [Desulfobulbaceae bacterium]
MGRMRFLCDVERCIDCDGCVVACKEGHHIPVGVNRRRVIAINEGEMGEKSISIACMHCSDAPCIAVCPVDAIYQRDDGIVLVSKKTCIGCGYCFMACPFGAPQFPSGRVFGQRGAMDKCTFCAGGPEETNSKEEKKLYGQNRIAEGKVPLCAAMCATKALMAGDSDKVADIYRERVFTRGSGANAWGWDRAYKKK